MKRFLAILLAAILLAGCSSNKSTNKEPSPKVYDGDPCSFLTEARWEGTDGFCTNTIRFGKDGSFSNFCACGEPVGFADVIERFRYQAEDQAILLYDDENCLAEEGKVLYVDAFYLVISLFDGVYCYYNAESEESHFPEMYLQLVGTAEQTTPYLHIIGYEDRSIAVMPYNYDPLLGDVQPTLLTPADNISIMLLTPNSDLFTTQTLTLDELASEDRPSCGLVFINKDSQITHIFFLNEI